MLNCAAVLAVGGPSAIFLGTGLIVVLLLIGAVWFGIRQRRAELAPPRPEDHPRRPAGDQHVESAREPDGTGFPTDGGRRTAHDMKGYGNFGSKPQGGSTPDEQ